MISIVICSINTAKFAAIQRHYAKVMGDEPYEIIGIHDATGLCEGYNRGLAQSAGEIVAFSHDDIEFLGSDVPQKIKNHLAKFDGIGVAGTDKLTGPIWADAGPPHLFGQVLHKVENGYRLGIYGVHRAAIGDMQAMDGLFLAFRREVIEKVGWDAEVFDGFHHYDLDCTFRAYQMGYQLAVVCDLPVFHDSGGAYDEKWQRSARAFTRKHEGKLAKRQPYRTSISAVDVRTKQEALAVMSPSYLFQP
jgi:GT2 family glycosyltransferase